MSYLVLARKWRPQTFEDILSQDLIANTLKNAIISKRIAHAYLFSGPRGVGKTTSARILAKALNCREYDEPTPTPCDKCTSCTEIRENRSPDVLEIDGASNRSVDDIQPLRERVQYAPQGRYRVIIIDEVHMLTTHAFNALLKTLEEPPPNVVFIFATTEPEKIPSTIISRCQRHDFKRIPTNKIQERIMQLGKYEDMDLDDDAALVIAKKADGALRDGLSLFDQVIAYAPSGKITRDMTARILGILPRDAFIQIADFATESKLLPMLDILHEVLRSGISPNSMIEGIIDGYREVMIDKLSNTNNPELKKIATTYDSKDFVRILKLLSETQSTMRFSKKPEYLLEEILLYISMMETTTELESLLKDLPDISPKAFASANPSTYSIEQKKPEPVAKKASATDIVQVQAETPVAQSEKPIAQDSNRVAPVEEKTETQNPKIETQSQPKDNSPAEDTDEHQKDSDDLIELFDAKPID